MTATFTLKTADFLRLQKLIARRHRKKFGFYSWRLALRVLVWFCIGLAGATYARAMREYPELSRPLELVAILLVVALLVIAIMPYVSQASMRKHMLAPNGAFLSPQIVTISAAAVTVDSVRGNTVVPWAGVLTRDEDDANYYLFVDEMQALVLPKAAIAGFESEFKQYTQHLKNAA